MNKFFKDLSDTFKFLGHNIEMIFTHPTLLIPTLVGWIFQSALVIYFKYYFDWNRFPLSTNLWIMFAATTSFCVVISICCLTLLEGVKQIDNGEETNLFKAVFEVFRKDFKKALPVAVVWAIILFIILVIEAIWLALTRGKGEKSSNNSSPSLEDISSTLAGRDSNRSFFSVSYWLEYLRKGIRLIVFFIYSAIVLDEKCSVSPIKRAFSLLKGNVTKFLSGFFLTEIFATIIFFPLGLTFYLSDKGVISLSDIHHVIIIAYTGFATSVYLSLQQIFTAMIYRNFVENKNE